MQKQNVSLPSALLDISCYFIRSRHYAERAFLGGYERCGCICENKKLMELLFVHFQTVFQDEMQSACAECIACAGRLDRCRIKETGFVSFNAVAVCLGRS